MAYPQFASLCQPSRFSLLRSDRDAWRRGEWPRS